MVNPIPTSGGASSDDSGEEDGEEHDCDSDDSDTQSDNQALDVQNQIEDVEAENPDHANIELGALIYRNAAGEIVRGPHVGGDKTTIPLENLIQATIQADSGFTLSSVVGFVHSHPTGSHDITNQAPSDGDISALNYFANNGADSSELTSYVIGPDNVMREYPLVVTPNDPSGATVEGCDS